MLISKLNYIGIAAGIIAMLIWSTLPYIIKQILNEINISTFLILKYGIPTLCLSLVLPGMLRKKISDITYSLVILSIMISVCNITLIFALTEILGSWYVVFFASVPILTLFISSKMRSCRVKLSLFIALVGCCFFIKNQEIVNYPTFKSIICLIVSTVAWVVVTLNIQKVQIRYSDLEITFFFNFVSFLSSVLVYLFSSEKFILPTIQISALFSFIWIFNPLSSLLFAISLRYTPAFCIVSQYLQLVFGLAIGIIIFKEPSNFLQLIGGSLLIVALLINNSYINKNVTD